MKATLLSLALLTSTAALGESAGGLNWNTPSGWKLGEARSMRAATYKIPPVKGDTDEAELAVFYFGAGQGGGVDANIQRWIAQFETAEGKPLPEGTKTKKETVNGFAVTTVEVSGVYTAAMGPMQPKSNKPNYKLHGAILEGPQGAIFFKLTGPTKTVDSAKPAFTKLLKSVKKE